MSPGAWQAGQEEGDCYKGGHLHRVSNFHISWRLGGGTRKSPRFSYSMFQGISRGGWLGIGSWAQSWGTPGCWEAEGPQTPQHLLQPVLCPQSHRSQCFEVRGQDSLSASPTTAANTAEGRSRAYSLLLLALLSCCLLCTCFRSLCEPTECYNLQ